MQGLPPRAHRRQRRHSLHARNARQMGVVIARCPACSTLRAWPGGGVSNAQPLSILASQAVDSLSGTHYAIADAIDQVPWKPGLYAVYADRETWEELNLEIREGGPLYVGKAEQSLQSRDIRTHFATGHTGSSTVRRSFAALLRNPLGLRGVPRNMERPEHPPTSDLKPRATNTSRPGCRSGCFWRTGPSPTPR